MGQLTRANAVNAKNTLKLSDGVEIMRTYIEEPTVHFTAPDNLRTNLEGYR